MAIHPLALVSPGAEIADDAEIGPWCQIGPKARIGRGTRLISHVVVGGRTTIGEDNTVFPFAVLGGVPQDLKYQGEDTELQIGNGNNIRESVTMNLGTAQGGGITRLGSNCLIMAYTHLGHDCQVGDHVVLANAVALAGHVVIEDYVVIGGVTGVVQFRRIGAHAYIGCTSAIIRDVPPYCVIEPECKVKGTNIIGLRRRGVSTDTIQKLNEVITLWKRQDVLKEKSLLEIESQYGEIPEVVSFLKFIRASESGVAR